MAIKYRVIIAGGRDLPVNDKSIEVALKELKKITKNPKQIELFSGMARGADQIPIHIESRHKVKCRRFPAKWTREDGTYNSTAGFERNHAMGDEATHLIAFWDGVSGGTADMIGYARCKGLVVKVLRYKVKPRKATY